MIIDTVILMIIGTLALAVSMNRELSESIKPLQRMLDYSYYSQNVREKGRNEHTSREIETRKFIAKMQKEREKTRKLQKTLEKISLQRKVI